MKALPLHRSWAVLPLLLILSSCAAARTAHPALWKVSGTAGTLYLFGTIHALPPNESWQTPAIRAAEAASDTLVVELSDINDRAALTQTLAGMAFAPNLPDVLDRVPPNQRDALAALIAQSGAAPQSLRPYKTWAVYLLVLNPVLIKTIGVDAADGVEQHLTADFTGQHKPITGLETTRYQIGIFDALPETTQRRMLSEMVRDFPTAKAEFEATLSAWERGDPDLIAKSFDKDLKEDPELAGPLLHTRNANWTHWALERLRHPGTSFVAVGAGHLAGDDSVIAMLRAAGAKVTRVE